METRGLVTACSEPFDIEVCGHETVSLALSPPELHFELIPISGNIVKPLNLNSLFSVDSKYCLVTIFEIHSLPGILYAPLDISVEPGTDKLVIRDDMPMQ